MRNLKKFLALVLAMMMVMGMMVTANATSYADESAISSDSREAIEILSAIKVFEGDGGYFNPKSYIRRADFSIVLYKLGTGDVNEKNALMNALEDQFSDVITGDNRSFGWAAPYVNYSAFKGWLEGDNGLGGPFRPGDNVTYYQVLVCMLRVLGLGDGINAKTWEFDTAEKATRLGLTDGIETMVGYATREDVAKMAFNALKYTEKKGTIYTVEASGSSITLQPPLYRGNNEYIAIATAAANEGSSTYETDDLTGSLADINFNGLHESGTIGADQFMRPATNWVDKNEKQVVSIPWTPDASYDGNFTLANAQAIWNASTNKQLDLNIYYNGTLTTGSSGAAVASVVAPEIFKEKTDDTVLGLWTGTVAATSKGIPGMEVEVYDMGTAGCRVVVREAIVGQITQLVDKEGKVTLQVYEASGGNATPTDADYAHTYGLTKPIATDEDYYPAAYNQLVNLSRGSIVGAYVNPYKYASGTGTSNGEILEIAPLTTVTAPVTRIDDNGANYNSTLTTASGTFKVNNAALWIGGTGRDVTTNVANTTSNLDRPKFNNNNTGRKVGTSSSSSSTLYILNNSVLLIDQSRAPSAANEGFGYLYDIDLTAGWMTQTGLYYNVNLYTPSGSQVVKAKLYDSCTPASNTFSGESASTCTDSGELYDINSGGILVYYYYNSTLGCYQISRVWTDSRVSVNGGVMNNGVDEDGNNLFIDDIEINKGVAQGSVTDASDGQVQQLVFDTVTTFYIVEGEPNDETVTVYNGVDKLPGSYETVDGEDWASAGNIAYALRKDITALQVVQAIVLRNPEGAGSMNEGYFIVGADKATHTTVTVDGKTYTYYQYKAVVNGKITDVWVNTLIDEVTPSDATTNGLPTKVVARSTMKLDPKAVLAGETVFSTNEGTPSQIQATAFTEATPVNIVDLTAGKAIVVNGNIKGFLTDSLPVYKYDTKLGTIEKIEVGDLSEPSAKWQGFYTHNSTDTVMTALYVMDVNA